MSEESKQNNANDLDLIEHQLKEQLKSVKLEDKVKPMKIKNQNNDSLTEFKDQNTSDSTNSDISSTNANCVASLSNLTLSSSSEPGSFLSLDCSMTSIHSVYPQESIESEMSLGSLQLSPDSDEEVLRADTLTPERDNSQSSPVISNLKNDEIPYVLKESSLRQLVSPNLHFEEIVSQFFENKCENSSNKRLKKPLDLKFSRNTKIPNQCREDLFVFYETNDPKFPQNNEEVDDNKLNPSDNLSDDIPKEKHQNSENEIKTKRGFMTTEERNKFYDNIPVITESTRTQELEKFINDIYNGLSSEKKEKIVTDLNTLKDSQTSQTPEEKEIESLINTVYFDYTSYQKKDIFEGLKEPKSERQQNKDVDNIEELIDKIYSGYSVSQSIEASKSGKTPPVSNNENSVSPQSETQINYKELLKLFGKIIPKKSTPNEEQTVPNQESPSSQTLSESSQTGETSSSISDSGLIEGKWRPAEDPVEPRPAKRSTSLRAKGAKQNQNYRSNEYIGE